MTLKCCRCGKEMKPKNQKVLTWVGRFLVKETAALPACVDPLCGYVDLTLETALEYDRSASLHVLDVLAHSPPTDAGYRWTLRFIRTALGLEQEQIAQHLGWKIERVKNPQTTAEYQAMALALNELRGEAKAPSERLVEIGPWSALGCT